MAKCNNNLTVASLPTCDNVAQSDYLIVYNNDKTCKVAVSDFIFGPENVDFYPDLVDIINNIETLSGTVYPSHENWTDTYNTVNTLSSSWNTLIDSTIPSLLTQLESNIDDFISTTTTVHTKSAFWDNTTELVTNGIATWDRIAAEVDANKGNWNTAYQAFQDESTAIIEALELVKNNNWFQILVDSEKRDDDDEPIDPDQLLANLYTTVSQTSSNWNNDWYNAHSALEPRVTTLENDWNSHVKNRYSIWDTTADIVETGATKWDEAYTITSDNSSDWLETYSTVFTNSATWSDAYSSVSDTSAFWNTAYDIVNQKTTIWNNAADAVAQRSDEWDDAYEIVDENYVKWNNTSDVVSTGNISWDETYTQVRLLSSSWGAMTDITHIDEQLISSSPSWDESYTYSVTTSSDWKYAYDMVVLYRKDWTDTFEIVRDTKDDWNSTRNTLYSTSGTWNNITTVVQTNSTLWNQQNSLDNLISEISPVSGDWNDTHKTVNDLSASWDKGGQEAYEVYTYVKSDSATNNTDYNRDTFVNVTGDTITGDLTVQGELILGNGGSSVGNLNVTGDIDVTGDIRATGSLFISENSVVFNDGEIFSSKDSKDLKEIVESYTTNEVSWNTSYNIIIENEIRWNEAYDIVTDNQDHWNYAYNTIQTNKTAWDSAVSKINNFADNWDDTHDLLNAKTPLWDATKARVDTDAASWDAARDDLLANRDEWVYAHNTVKDSKTSWDSAYDRIELSAEDWDDAYDAIVNNSLDWTNTYTRVDNSADLWDDVYTRVKTNSAFWNTQTDVTDITTTLSVNSGDWERVYSVVYNNSGDWFSPPELTNRLDQLYSWVNSDSATNNSDYNRTTFVNTSGDKITGDLTITGQISGTTAVFTSITALSSVVDVIDIKVRELSGYDIIDGDLGVEGNISAEESLYVTHGDVIFGDSNFDHGHVHTPDDIEHLSKQDVRDFKSTNLCVYGASADWYEVYTNVNINSGDWFSPPELTALIQSNSGDWNSVYTDVKSSSADWYEVYTNVNNNSGDWFSPPELTSLIQSNSGDWNSVYTSVKVSSADWYEVYTNVNTNSGDWFSPPELTALIQSNSGDWNDTHTTLNTTSADWDSTRTIVDTHSADWNSTRTTTNVYSADWQSVTTDVNNISANWNESYTTTKNVSSDWSSVVSTVNTNSGDWFTPPEMTTLIQTKSGDWNDTHTTLNTTSGKWGSAYSWIQSDSATNNTQYNEDKFVNASGDTITGGLTVDGILRGTTAVFTSVSAVSSFVDVIDIKVRELSGYDIIDGDLGVEGDINVHNTLYITHGELVFGDSTHAHGHDHTPDEIESFSILDLRDFKSTAITVNSVSSDWSSVVSTVNTNSGDWFTPPEMNTLIQTKSGDWNDTHTTLNTTSADWQSTNASVKTTSGDWNSTRTTVDTYSADWQSVVTDVNTTSADWNSTRTTLNTTSATWDSVYSWVNGDSATNNSDYNRTAFVNVSGDTIDGDLNIDSNLTVHSDLNVEHGSIWFGHQHFEDGHVHHEADDGHVEELSRDDVINFKSTYNNVTTNSADWQSTNVSVNTTSANWNSVYTDVSQTSADWNDTHSTTNTYSADWQSVTTDVNATSADWNDTHSTTNTYSADWQSTNVSVNTTSADWNDTHSTTNTYSADWQSTNVSVNTTSADWDSVYSWVNSDSATNNSDYNRTTFVNTSGDTITGELNIGTNLNVVDRITGREAVFTSLTALSSVVDVIDIKVRELSGYDIIDGDLGVDGSASIDHDLYITHGDLIFGDNNFAHDHEHTPEDVEVVTKLDIRNFKSAYTTVSANSAVWEQLLEFSSVNWDSTYNTVSSLSADWSSTTTTTNTYSADWQSVVTDVSATSGNWNSVYSWVQSDSATNNSDYNRNTFFNVSGDTITGKLSVKSDAIFDNNVEIKTGEIIFGDHDHDQFHAEYLEHLSKQNVVDFKSVNLSVNTTSASWDNVYNYVNTTSATNNSDYNRTTFVNTSGDTIEGGLNVVGQLSGTTAVFTSITALSSVVDVIDIKVRELSGYDIIDGDLGVEGSGSFDTDLYVTHGDVIFGDSNYHHGHTHTPEEIEHLSKQDVRDFKDLNTTVFNVSADWNSTRTTVDSYSADWQSVTTDVNVTSADWNSTQTTLNTTSADWQSTNVSVNTTSADRNSTRTTVESYSADWQSTNVSVNTTSADWNSTRTTVDSYSADWQSDVTTTNTYSADWQSVVTDVNATSADWNSVYSWVNSDSGTNNSDYNRTTFVNTSGDTITGGLNIVGQLSGTTAVFTSITALSSVVDVIDIKVRELSGYDIIDGDLGVEGHISTEESIYITHGDVIFGDSNFEHDHVHTSEDIEHLSKQDVRDFKSNNTTTNTYSADWQSVTTDVNASSADWDSTRTTTNTYSADWQSVVADVNATSANWDSVYSWVKSDSATNNSDYNLTTFVNASGDTITGALSVVDDVSVYSDLNVRGGDIVFGNPYYLDAFYQTDLESLTKQDVKDFKSVTTDVNATSADWDSTRTTVDSYSADWQSDVTTTKAYSADWQSVTTDVNATSADWDSTRNSVNSTSANWDSVYNWVQSDSATNNSDYNRTTFVNTSGDTIEGGLNIVGQLSGTTAVFTAITALSSVVDVIDIKVRELSGYDIIDGDLGVEGSGSFDTDLYVTHGDIIFGDSNFAHGHVHTPEDIEHLSKQDVRDFKSTNLSVYGASADWNSTNVSVNTNSANWMSTHVSVLDTSATWNSVYSTTNTYSADWQSDVTTTNTYSADWQSDVTTTNTYSADWQSTRNSVNNTSASWNSVYSWVNSDSATNNSDYNRTTFVNTSGDTIEGGLNVVGQLSGTTAVFTSITALSSVVDVIDIKVRELSGYDIIDGDLGVEGNVTADQMLYITNGDIVFGDSGLAHNHEHTPEEIEYLSKQDVRDFKSTESSVFTTSATWDSVYTSVLDTSATWDSTHTSVYDNSANWVSTYTSVLETSASWDSVYSWVNSDSATNNSDYNRTTFVNASGDTIGGNLTVIDNFNVHGDTHLRGDLIVDGNIWFTSGLLGDGITINLGDRPTDQITFIGKLASDILLTENLKYNLGSEQVRLKDIYTNTVDTLSTITAGNTINIKSGDLVFGDANIHHGIAHTPEEIEHLSRQDVRDFKSVRSSVYTTSSDWDSTRNTIYSTSADWNSTHSSVNNTSASWDSVYSWVNSDSATNNSDYNRTTFVNTSGDTIEGGLNIVGQLSGTTAVFTSITALSSVVDVIDIKVRELSGYDIIDGDFGVEGSGTILSDLYVTEGDIIFGDNNFAHGYIHTPEDIEHFSKQDVRNFKSTYSTVYNNSADWYGVYDHVNLLSANWQSTWESVLATSANWDSVYTDVSQTSADWDSTYTTTEAYSADWQSVVSDVNAASATWDSVYSWVSSDSATNNSSYNETTYVNAAGDTVTGSLEVQQGVITEVVKSNDPQSALKLYGGTDNSDGARLELYGANNSNSQFDGRVQLQTNDFYIGDIYDSVDGNKPWMLRIDVDQKNFIIGDTTAIDNSILTVKGRTTIDGDTKIIGDINTSGQVTFNTTEPTVSFDRWDILNFKSTYTNVFETSADWDSTRNTVYNISGHWNDTYNVVKTASGDWDSTHTSVNRTSAIWDSTHTSVNRTSASWDSVYSWVNGDSATNNSDYNRTTFVNTSGDTIEGGLNVVGQLSGTTAIFTSITALSSVVDVIDIKVRELSGYDIIDGNLGVDGDASIDHDLFITHGDLVFGDSIIEHGFEHSPDDLERLTKHDVRDFKSTYTSVYNTSSDWDSTRTTTNTYSADWQSDVTTTNAYSADWQSDVTTTNAYSADWQSDVTTTNTYSADWQSDVTTTNTYSADWQSDVTTTNTYSADWQSDVTTTNTYSADWQSVTTDVNATSADWNSVYSWVNSDSATNNSDYNRTTFVNTSGDTIEGNLTVTGQLSGTTAVFTSITAISSVVDVIDIKVRELSGYDIIDGDLRVQGDATVDRLRFAESLDPFGEHNEMMFTSNFHDDNSSGITDTYHYTHAVNVFGDASRVINDVEFEAEKTGATDKWSITAGTGDALHLESTSVTGDVGELLNDNFRYIVDEQKVILKGLTIGRKYLFTLYGQAWSTDSISKRVTLSTTANNQTIEVDQDEFESSNSDGQLINAIFYADESEVEFIITPEPDSTFHLYAFSNREVWFYTSEELIALDIHNFRSTYSSVLNTSANWDSTHTSVYDNSANWVSTHESVNATSANWDSVYSWVKADSATNNSDYNRNTYVNVSGDTITGELSVKDVVTFDTDLTVGNQLSVVGYSSFGQGLTAEQNVYIKGDLRVDGNVWLLSDVNSVVSVGESEDDVVVFWAPVDSSVIPFESSVHTLGKQNKKWKNIYTDGLTIGEYTLSAHNLENIDITVEAVAASGDKWNESYTQTKILTAETLGLGDKVDALYHYTINDFDKATVTYEPTLADYISDEYTLGSVGVGDTVIVAAENTVYVLVNADGTKIESWVEVNAKPNTLFYRSNLNDGDIIDSIDITKFRSAKYIIEITGNDEIMFTELNLVVTKNQAKLFEYGTNQSTDEPFVTFDAVLNNQTSAADIVMRQVPGSIASIWSPAGLSAGPLTWLDAANDDKVIVDSNDIFNRWDGSGHTDLVMYSRPGSEPEYVTQGDELLNNRNVLKFTGDSDFIQSDYYDGSSVGKWKKDPAVWCLVFKPTGINNFHDYLLWFEQSTGQDLAIVPKDNDEFFGAPWLQENKIGNGAYPFTETYSETDLSNQWNIFELELNPVTQRAGMYLNGHAIQIDMPMDYQFPEDAEHMFRLHANWIGSQYTDGYLAEFVVMNDYYRVKTEGYLAWKWGLVDKLPEDHLYKTIPPFMEGVVKGNRTNLF